MILYFLWGFLVGTSLWTIISIPVNSCVRSALRNQRIEINRLRRVLINQRTQEDV